METDTPSDAHLAGSFLAAGREARQTLGCDRSPFLRQALSKNRRIGCPNLGIKAAGVNERDPLLMQAGLNTLRKLGFQRNSK
jgi:hypothetical protein